MFDAQSKDEKPKKSPTLSLKYIPPQPSAGALLFSMKAGGTEVEIPIAYGKIEQGGEVKSGPHKATFTHGFKWGSPLTKEFNPDHDTVVTYHEAELAYAYTYGNGLSFGAVFEDRQKFSKTSGDNWLRAMAAVKIPGLNTVLRAGPLRHLAPSQKGTRFSWQAVQPLVGVKGDRASGTLIFISEGEIADKSSGWMNNILAIKIKY
jgi:hypothetical protein